jgi:peptidoglycan pentaglycine glycine transferase (the first glycine)
VISSSVSKESGAHHPPDGVSRSERTYQLRVLSPGQRALWNQFVSTHPHGHLLQSWEWGEFKARTGWSTLRLALWHTDTQRIVAAAQVLLRTAPHFPLWAGHLAYIPRGPVIDWTQPELCAAFFSQLDRQLRHQGAIVALVEPALSVDAPESASALHQLADWGAHTVRPLQPLRTIMLDLTPDEETLLAHMKEKWRYNVRLAARKGVTIRDAQTSDDVRAWYDLMRITSVRDEFGIHILEYYLQAWRMLAGSLGDSLETEQARLLLAEHDGQLLAGIFVAYFGDEAIYLYGASSNEKRNLMPNYLLQWEAIRWAKRSGAQHYDFWGIPATDNEDEAMAGVYRFKRGWGGQIITFLGAYEKVYRPLAMRVARPWLGSIG